MHCFCFRILYSKHQPSSFQMKKYTHSQIICYNHSKIDFGVAVKVIFQPTKSNSFTPVQFFEMKTKKKL